MMKGAIWCVCKKGADPKVLQKAIDYACGNGADCSQTREGGKCFNPDTVMGHCNYVVNSYFQNKAQTHGSCDFTGAAILITTDPSFNGCSFPSSGSGTSVSTSPTTNTKPPSSITTSTSPFGYNKPSSSGILSGEMAGLSPSGPDMDTDVSDGGVSIRQKIGIFGFVATMSAGVVMFM